MPTIDEDAVWSRVQTRLEAAPQVGSPGWWHAWLLCIAHNRAIGELRRRRSALMRLNEDQRAVLVLRFLRGLANAEVATQLGKTEQAARALQYRALNRLRDLMGDATRPG